MGAGMDSVTSRTKSSSLISAIIYPSVQSTILWLVDDDPEPSGKRRTVHNHSDEQLSYLSNSPYRTIFPANLQICRKPLPRCRNPLCMMQSAGRRNGYSGTGSDRPGA